MHLPLGDSTLYILSEEGLRLMKQTVVLVNILRGRLIDQFFLKKMFMAKCLANTAFDVLKTVTMISDEMSWSSGGMCGKKQLIPVGMGGPAIKCKVNIGGR